MWWPPIVALAGTLLTDPRTLTRVRPRWVDLPIALWCLWPLLRWGFVADAVPKPWIASLYLTTAWGTPWLLGRVYFEGVEGNKRFMMSLAAGLVVIAPIAFDRGYFRSTGLRVVL
jgi:hypothetical protein